MLILKKELFSIHVVGNEHLPWEMVCPGCDENIWIMEDIPYKKCWKCGTTVKIGTSTVTGNTPEGRINYYCVGWPLNDRKTDKAAQ